MGLLSSRLLQSNNAFHSPLSTNQSLEMPSQMVSPVSQLDARIQGLPQELQDSILELTNVEQLPIGSVTITKAHIPPSALHLNHKIRTDFARQYYSTTTFIGEHNLHCPGDCGPIIRWMASLSAAHLKAIRMVHLPVNSTSPTVMKNWVQWVMEDLEDVWEARGIQGRPFPDLWAVINFFNAAGEIVGVADGSCDIKWKESE